MLLDFCSAHGRQQVLISVLLPAFDAALRSLAVPGPMPANVTQFVGQYVWKSGSGVRARTVLENEGDGFGLFESDSMVLIRWQ